MDAIIAKLPPITLQPAYYNEQNQLVATGDPIEVKIGGPPALLPPVNLEVESVSGLKTYTQGPLGGLMRVEMLKPKKKWWQ